MRLDGSVRLTTEPWVAAEALFGGHLAALPTETVYGLGARADMASAIARVYAVKGRPADHPLIVHVAGVDALDAWGEGIPAYARSLADATWPGPLTLVVNRTSAAGDFITGGQGSVAVRVSAHPLMAAVLDHLIELTGDPAIGIAAPSANRFGRVSPTSARHVVEELEAFMSDDDVVLDGGECAVGLESTIIDCSGDGPKLLRPGAITAADVTRITGLACPSGSTVRASGTLDSHYSPAASVRLLNADQLTAHAKAQPADGMPSSGLLAIASIPTPPGIVRLAAPTTTDDYARILYSALREADALGLALVLAVPPDPAGVGAAVIDRLTRAAHGD
jgi:L-threonylcarbamoyladenylate synthase